MLISEAYADSTAVAPAAPPAAPSAPAAATGTAIGVPEQAAIPQETQSPFAGMGILLLIVPIFYFLIIRPNQKKIKDFETMVKALRRGDRVVTGGGIIGVITRIENDDVLVVEIAPEVKVRVMRETISHVVNKTAVNDNKAEEKSGKPDDKATGG